jgi:hypothetical protein
MTYSKSAMATSLRLGLVSMVVLVLVRQWFAEVFLSLTTVAHFDHDATQVEVDI